MRARDENIKFWVLVVVAAGAIFVLAGNLVGRLVYQCVI